jgi:hypothetical protein
METASFQKGLFCGFGSLMGITPEKVSTQPRRMYFFMSSRMAATEVTEVILFVLVVAVVEVVFVVAVGVVVVVVVVGVAVISEAVRPEEGN